MELIIEIAMDGERELYKEDNSDVSNGYCPRRIIYASGHMLELRVPRTHQRGFIPLILSVLKEQERKMGEWAEAISIAVGIRWRISQVSLSRAYSTARLIISDDLNSIEEGMHFSGVEVHLCRFTSSENRLVRYAPEIKQPLPQTSKKSLAKGFPPTPADGLMRVSEPLPIDGVEVILFSPK